MKEGEKVIHAIYGKGHLARDPEEFKSHQFEGSAAWCVFNNPKTGIAGGFPYMIPVSDLEIQGEQD